MSDRPDPDRLPKRNPMDPQLKSALTSLGMIVATAIAAWAASHGLISAGDQVNVANALVASGGAIATVGLIWWKTRDHSQIAIIEQINDTDNGVKVVSDDVSASKVTAPLK
jgi:hypothetical protein